MQMESYLNNYLEYIRKTSDELRDTTMPEITEELFSLYEKTGNRIQYEKVYFERRKFLAIFGMAAVIYHRKDDIRKLENIIREICSEECWALPAHVDRKNNSDWKITIELFSSETAQALTEIAELLNSELSYEIQDLIDENVTKRVLKPFYSSSPPYDNWEFCEMNWNAVCAGCIGYISIYRYRYNDAMLDACINRINQALTFYINGFSEDGVCAEGLDYWTYGMSYYVMYARRLKEHTDGRTDLLKTEKMKKIMTFQQKCYFNDGTSISFSDGSIHSHFRIGLTSYLAGNYDGVHFPDMKNAMKFEEDECFRWAPAYRDYAWTKEYLENNEVSEKKAGDETAELGNPTFESHVFESAQWMICNGENSGMAVKGGNNNEPHNHNDIGNFIYVSNGVEFLADLGAGEYCKDYFNEKRYTIFCNNSESHNVPIINNMLQMTGEEYFCTRFETDNEQNVVLNFGQAYEKNCIKDIERNIRFEGETGELYVSDTFSLNENTESIQENLITKQNIFIEDNIIILTENSSKCKIVIDDKKACPKVHVRTHLNHIGQEEKVNVIRWKVFEKIPEEAGMDTVKCSFKVIPYL